MSNTIATISRAPVSSTAIKNDLDLAVGAAAIASDGIIYGSLEMNARTIRRRPRTASSMAPWK